MSQNPKWNALKKIIRRLPAQSVYYGSALGAIVLAGGGQLPPGLEFVAGGFGANVLSNLIEEIARGEDLLDDDIRTRTEDAIQRSDIANLLTKQDFLQGYARLIQRLDAQKEISEEILTELQSGFDKVATAEQVDELKALILDIMKSTPQQPMHKSRVFISYARADDEPFVEKLYNDLKDEFEVWWDRVSMPNRGLTFLQEIRDGIDNADRLLLVAGPHAFTSDYVRDEWQYAYETYKGINIVLRLGDYPDLPEQLGGFDAPDFRSDDNYDERLTTLKRQLAEPVAPIGQFHNVPALPPHFLSRPEALDTLRDLVITDVDKPTLISAEKRTTAVEGMGGIGKSVMATAFAHDRKVRFAFPDGIVWLTTGHKPSMYELYRAVGVALGDDLSNYPDETTARQNAQKALVEKKCLLILDDVWELPVGRAFRDLIAGTPTRLLITTRNLQINNVLNVNEYRLKLIDESQAVDYLRSWVGDGPDLETVAEKLGYLFLALKLAGARMKKDGLSGEDYLLTFDRVSRMKIDRQSSDREDSLEASITLSVDAAFANAEDEKLLYHTFGIFLEDTPVPQQTIVQLWQHLRPDVDDFDLLETLNTLVDLALVERNADDRTITLHDLLHSYTREKLDKSYVQTHQDLLSSYRQGQNGDGWHTVPNDEYLYDYLAYHLISANQYDDLRSLFLNGNWAKVRVEQKGYLYEGYLSDLIIAWDFAHAQALNLWDEEFFTDCARYALITTKVNNLSTMYVPELVIRALQLDIPNWTNERALSIASRVTNSEQRLYFYVKLLSSGQFTGKQKEFCVENTVSALEETIFSRAPSRMVRRGVNIEVYEELAANIQNEVNYFQRLLNVLFQEDAEYNIARVIERIGQYIPAVLLDRLLEKILKLKFDGDWGSLTYKAVKGIAHILSSEQLEFVASNTNLDTLTRELAEGYLGKPEVNSEIVRNDIELPNDYDEFINNFEFSSYGLLWIETPRLNVLKALAGKLSANQLNVFVDKALAFKDSSHPSEFRREIFKILAPHLNENMQIKVLHKCNEIDNSLGREFTSVLSSLAHHLSPTSVTQAYEILKTRIDQDNGFRILAPVLDEPLVMKAIKDASQSGVPFGIISAMIHFIPHLPSDLHQDIVRQILVDISAMGRYSSYQREKLLIDLTKANIQDIELATEVVRFIFNSNLFLLEMMSSLAQLLLILYREITHPNVLELMSELQDQIEKVDNRDKPFVITYLICLKLKLLDVASIENKAQLQEENKNYLILAVERLMEWGNLQPFFAAILVSQNYLEGDRLDQVLSMILSANLDYSNTNDLSFFSAFAPKVTDKVEWLSQLIDELIRIRGGYNTNAPLLRALTPTFLDKPDLLHKALHYADVLLSSDDRIPAVIEIASHLQDEYYRFHLINRELQTIKKAVKDGLHTDEISFVSHILEECGNVLSNLEQEFEVFVNVVNSLPNPYAQSRSLASVGSSPYFTEELRLDLQKSFLKALYEERFANIANVWHILSYPPFLEQLQLTSTAIAEIYNMILEIENQWEWL